MNGPLRVAARAFLLATLTALVVDAVLATLTGLVAVAGAGDGTPWWVAAHLVERGRWVAAAALLVAVAGRIASPEEPASRAAVWRFVGIAAAPEGGGYYMVATDGGVFNFGPGTTFSGSTGNITLNQPINGIAAFQQ